eukprot:365444-Chlamydomonas_euryale.AAC.10
MHCQCTGFPLPALHSLRMRDLSSSKLLSTLGTVASFGAFHRIIHPNGMCATLLLQHRCQQELWNPRLTQKLAAHTLGILVKGAYPIGSAPYNSDSLLVAVGEAAAVQGSGRCSKGACVSNRRRRRGCAVAWIVPLRRIQERRPPWDTECLKGWRSERTAAGAAVQRPRCRCGGLLSPAACRRGAAGRPRRRAPRRRRVRQVPSFQIRLPILTLGPPRELPGLALGSPIGGKPFGGL